MTIAFTGHRPEGLPFGDNEICEQCRMLKKMLWVEIKRRIGMGYDTFYCGAARGSDIICGELVLLMQPRVSVNLKLICVTPFKEQARGWSEQCQKRYERLLQNAFQVVQLSEHYYHGCYHTRDRYLVDHADTLLAVYNGSGRGGTAYTVGYAHEKKKEIVVFDPFIL